MKVLVIAWMRTSAKRCGWIPPRRAQGDEHARRPKRHSIGSLAPAPPWSGSPRSTGAETQAVLKRLLALLPPPVSSIWRRSPVPFNCYPTRPAWPETGGPLEVKREYRLLHRAGWTEAILAAGEDPPSRRNRRSIARPFRSGRRWPWRSASRWAREVCTACTELMPAGFFTSASPHLVREVRCCCVGELHDGRPLRGLQRACDARRTFRRGCRRGRPGARPFLGAPQPRGDRPHESRASLSDSSWSRGRDRILLPLSGWTPAQRYTWSPVHRSSSYSGCPIASSSPRRPPVACRSGCPFWRGRTRWRFAQVGKGARWFSSSARRARRI